jgi:hypothetical protein
VKYNCGGKIMSEFVKGWKFLKGIMQNFMKEKNDEN